MPEFDDRPAYSFNPGPPPEVSRFLRNKGWQPAFSWQDVEPEEHAVAFTVAKATSMDVLSDIREELQTAIDEGLPFAEFQKRLTPRLQARGWWGDTEATDPLTGEVVQARLGTPRRLRTIYDANLRSARSAGQWERIERTKEALPYLEYRLGPSERHRTHHEDKEGLVLPVDDPFWRQWMPPNGWGCKCWVRQLTSGQAERRGVDQSPDVPDRNWTNGRTGEVRRVPLGIDPGWDRNPGQLRLQGLEEITRGKLDQLTDDQATAALKDMGASWAAGRAASGESAALVPIGRLPEAIAARIGTGRNVGMTGRGAAHVFLDRGDRTVAELRTLARMSVAGRFAIQTDSQGRRSVHVFVPPDEGGRTGVRGVIYFAEGQAYLVTAMRWAAAKWERRVVQGKEFEVVE